mmetsp:Transcript_24648/g.62398  ORF Transcript_24648/g.62398 Transcript_24648/m.62398 type:complete len:267 (-) Transcript_24648:1009-1809(-)
MLADRLSKFPGLLSTGSYQALFCPFHCRRAVRGGNRERLCRYSVVPREYFYFVDANGRLFLEETKRRNRITCLKDAKFLNFFFRRLEINSLDSHSSYPYISKCGREVNYVKAEETGIVYDRLERFSREGGDLKLAVSPDKFRRDILNIFSSVGRELPSSDRIKSRWVLTFAHSLCVPFFPSWLSVTEDGKLYYPCHVSGFALVRSSLAVELFGRLNLDHEWGACPPFLDWDDDKVPLQLLREHEISETFKVAVSLRKTKCHSAVVL